MMEIEKQWRKLKAEHPESLILFVVGDFHETVADDAFIVAEALGLNVVARKKTAKKPALVMCGFPSRLADDYISKLVKAGHRVVICEETG